MASCRSFIFSTGILVMVFLSGTMATVNCPEAFSVLPDSDHCEKFLQCVFKVPYHMPCPPGLGFSAKRKVCVYLSLSDCADNGSSQATKKLSFKPVPSSPRSTSTPTPSTTTATETMSTEATTLEASVATKVTTHRERPVILQRSIEEKCERNPRARFPHPTECALYYDCSMIYKNVPKFFEQFLKECKYPDLFDERSSRCEHFKKVRCGRRREVKEPCEYRQNFCQTANCRPCSARFPSCGDRPDGINAWGAREWTPYFIRCEMGRLMDQGTCEHKKGYPTLFSPDSKKCVSIFTVPKKFGGNQPDCTRRDGFFADEKKRCQFFYQCHRGEYMATLECTGGRVFDSFTSLCKYPKEVQGRCRSYVGK